MSETKLILVAAIALMDNDGRLLLAQRPPGKSMAGMWEFPGGKVEIGETPEQALVREVKEELGIAILEKDLEPFQFASHAYEKFHLLMPVYRCLKWDGEIKGCEGQALEWADLETIDSFNVPPADIELIQTYKDWAVAFKGQNTK